MQHDIYSDLESPPSTRDMVEILSASDLFDRFLLVQGLDMARNEFWIVFDQKPRGRRGIDELASGTFIECSVAMAAAIDPERPAERVFEITPRVARSLPSEPTL